MWDVPADASVSIVTECSTKQRMQGAFAAYHSLMLPHSPRGAGAVPVPAFSDCQLSVGMSYVHTSL